MYTVQTGFWGQSDQEIDETDPCNQVKWRVKSDSVTHSHEALSVKR